MKVEDLKWYSPFLLLVGTILSFADPITDILTLVEFYRADHKIWFRAGLLMVISPCFAFLPLYWYLRDQELSKYSNTRKYTQKILCGFHPFSAAFARLQGFIFCLKKLWSVDEIDSTGNEEAENLLRHMEWSALFESLLESAPQFVLQLYAVSVQEEPVEVIQIISLPVSFVSLAWAFTAADELTLTDNRNIIDGLNIKHKIALFVTHLFLLSSRLFAVCYCFVSFKWWAYIILCIHIAVIFSIAFFIQMLIRDRIHLLMPPFISLSLLCIYSYWLRDYVQLPENSSDYDNEDPRNYKNELKAMQVLSNYLFVIENSVMIMLFNFSQHSNTWYSLPVTVCVCVFSVLGSVMRFIIYHRVILKERIVPVLND